MTDTAPIGYAVTAVLPNRYFQASLYVEVPADSLVPDAVARRHAQRLVQSLANEVPDARLSVTQVRRLG